MLAHLGEGHVHIVRPGQVAGGTHEGVSLRIEHVEDAGDRDEHVIIADHDLRLGLAVASAVPVPEPVTAAAPSAALVVLVARGPTAGRHRLPVPTAALLAAIVAATVAPAVITAALVPTTLVPAALIAARLFPTTLIASAVVAAGLLTGHLVPAALRLVVAAPVPAPPVTALRLARTALVPDTRLGVLTHTLGWATLLLGSGLLGSGLLSGGLLSCGLLGSGLLGSGLLSCDLLSGSLLGLAIRPVGHGRLVEAELLSPSVRADPVARAGA